MQMINAVAAIANGGVLLQPHMVQAMVKDGLVYTVSPHIIGRQEPVGVSTTSTVRPVRQTNSRPTVG